MMIIIIIIIELLFSERWKNYLSVCFLDLNLSPLIMLFDVYTRTPIVRVTHLSNFSDLERERETKNPNSIFIRSQMNLISEFYSLFFSFDTKPKHKWIHLQNDCLQRDRTDVLSDITKLKRSINAVEVNNVIKLVLAIQFYRVKHLCYNRMKLFSLFLLLSLTALPRAISSWCSFVFLFVFLSRESRIFQEETKRSKWFDFKLKMNPFIVFLNCLIQSYLFSIKIESIFLLPILLLHLLLINIIIIESRQINWFRKFAIIEIFLLNSYWISIFFWLNKFRFDF